MCAKMIYEAKGDRARGVKPIFIMRLIFIRTKPAPFKVKFALVWLCCGIRD